MTDRLVIWPSSVHRNLVCPASAYPRTQDDGTILHEEAGENAAVGRAVHRAIREMITLGMDSPPDVTGICLDEGCGDAVTRVRVMVHYAARAWKEILAGVDPSVRRAGANWACIEDRREAHFGWLPESTEIVIHGVVDLWWYSELADEVYLVEWKSGIRDESAADQTKCYATLVFDEVPASRLSTKLVWLQDQTTTTLTYTRGELAEWSHDLFKALHWDGKTFTPGAVCRWCRNGPQCPARKKWLSQAVVLFAQCGDQMMDLTQFTPEQLGRAYDQAQVLEDMIGKFREALRGHAVCGGPIPRGDGRVIDCQPVRGRVSLNDEAVCLLKMRYGGEVIDPLLKLDWGDAKEVIRSHAGKGEKQKEEERVLGELIESGAAVRGPTYYKLITRKEKEAIEA